MPTVTKDKVMILVSKSDRRWLRVRAAMHGCTMGDVIAALIHQQNVQDASNPTARLVAEMQEAQHG